MSLGEPTVTTHPTADVVPHPVLFNAWKHHAGYARRRVAEAVRLGPVAVERLAAELAVVGGRPMDLYVGPLGTEEIAGRVLDQLRADGRLDLDAYRAWLDGLGGYAVLTVPDDRSRWALRLGRPEGRYVHLHPGRYSPHTVRVQANALKTAVVAHALAGLTGGSPTDVAQVNEARKRYLGLPPVPALDTAGGLGEVIGLLNSPGTR